MKIRIHSAAMAIVVFIIFQVTALAQKPDSGGFEFSSPDLESQLVSLDSIIKIAMKRSPYLKYDSALIDATKQDVVLAKRKWHDNIFLYGNYSYGNQKFVIATSTTDQQKNLLNGYRYGVNLNIPLSDFTTRKFLVRQTQAELNASIHKREQTEMELRRQVILEYNDLLASQKLLKISGAGKENLLVLQQLGEKQFKEGTTTLEEYAHVCDMAVKAEAEFELAKSKFESQYLQLEDLLGVRLTTLMRKK